MRATRDGVCICEKEKCCDSPEATLTSVLKAPALISCNEVFIVTEDETVLYFEYSEPSVHATPPASNTSIPASCFGCDAETCVDFPNVISNNTPANPTSSPT